MQQHFAVSWSLSLFSCIPSSSTWLLDSVIQNSCLCTTVLGNPENVKFVEVLTIIESPCSLFWANILSGLTAIAASGISVNHFVSFLFLMSILLSFILFYFGLQPTVNLLLRVFHCSLTERISPRTQMMRKCPRIQFIRFNFIIIRSVLSLSLLSREMCDANLRFQVLYGSSSRFLFTWSDFALFDIFPE